MLITIQHKQFVNTSKLETKKLEMSTKENPAVTTLSDFELIQQGVTTKTTQQNKVSTVPSTSSGILGASKVGQLNTLLKSVQMVSKKSLPQPQGNININVSFVCMKIAK